MTGESAFGSRWSRDPGTGMPVVATRGLAKRCKKGFEVQKMLGGVAQVAPKIDMGTFAGAFV